MGDIPLAMQDILYDPQTSGGLMISVAKEDADACFAEIKAAIPEAAIIGFVTAFEGASICLE